MMELDPGVSTFAMVGLLVLTVFCILAVARLLR